MSLSHHSLVCWQRADDLFIKLPSAFVETVSGVRALRARRSVEACGVFGRVGYISKETSDALETDIKQTGAPLAGLIRSLGTREQEVK